VRRRPPAPQPGRLRSGSVDVPHPRRAPLEGRAPAGRADARRGRRPLRRRRRDRPRRQLRRRRGGPLAGRAGRRDRDDRTQRPRGRLLPGERGAERGRQREGRPRRGRRSGARRVRRRGARAEAVRADRGREGEDRGDALAARSRRDVLPRGDEAGRREAVRRHARRTDRRPRAGGRLRRVSPLPGGASRGLRAAVVRRGAAVPRDRRRVHLPVRHPPRPVFGRPARRRDRGAPRARRGRGRRPRPGLLLRIRGRRGVRRRPDRLFAVGDRRRRAEHPLRPPELRPERRHPGGRPDRRLPRRRRGARRHTPGRA